MWKDLTISQKGDIIKMSLQNGIKGLDEIKRFYDETAHKFDDGGFKEQLSKAQAKWDAVNDQLKNNPFSIDESDTYDIYKYSGKRPETQKDLEEIQNKENEAKQFTISALSTLGSIYAAPSLISKGKSGIAFVKGLKTAAGRQAVANTLGKLATDLGIGYTSAEGANKISEVASGKTLDKNLSVGLQHLNIPEKTSDFIAPILNPFGWFGYSGATRKMATEGLETLANEVTNKQIRNVNSTRSTNSIRSANTNPNSNLNLNSNPNPSSSPNLNTTSFVPQNESNIVERQIENVTPILNDIQKFDIFDLPRDYIDKPLSDLFESSFKNMDKPMLIDDNRRLKALYDRNPQEYEKFVEDMYSKYNVVMPKFDLTNPWTKEQLFNENGTIKNGLFGQVYTGSRGRFRHDGDTPSDLIEKLHHIENDVFHFSNGETKKASDIVLQDIRKDNPTMSGNFIHTHSGDLSVDSAPLAWTMVARYKNFYPIGDQTKTVTLNTLGIKNLFKSGQEEEIQTAYKLINSGGTATYIPKENIFRVTDESGGNSINIKLNTPEEIIAPLNKVIDLVNKKHGTTYPKATIEVSKLAHPTGLPRFIVRSPDIRGWQYKKGGWLKQ